MSISFSRLEKFFFIIFPNNTFGKMYLWFAYILGLCVSFKWTLLETGSFFCHPNPHWFLQPEVMRLYFPSFETLICVVWPGAGITHSPGVPPGFYLPHMNMGPLILLATAALCPLWPGSPSLPLLLIWMNNSSLNPWLSDFHTV